MGFDFYFSILLGVPLLKPLLGDFTAPYIHIHTHVLAGHFCLILCGPSSCIFLVLIMYIIMVLIPVLMHKHIDLRMY